MVKKTDSVFVLTRIGEPDTAWAKAPLPSRENKGSGGSEFNANNVPVGKAMADYLEVFGIVGLPVLDETGDVKRYDISFQWEPEKKGAVREFLQSLGLQLQKQQREYEVLLIYK